MTAARPIWAVRAADRTAAKSRRHGHPEAAPWPHQIISLDVTWYVDTNARCDKKNVIFMLNALYGAKATGVILIYLYMDF